jgi:hypothetical protein
MRVGLIPRSRPLSTAQEGKNEMRHITLAAAALAALALAGAAYADSNYGPRKQGNQCWHQQLGNSLGYWGACENPQNAQAQRAKAAGKSKTANTPNTTTR